MPSISKKNKDKISEQILHHLFSQSPDPQHPSHIASSLARDEEFIKSLLLDLEIRKLVVKITKGPQGQDYTRRTRWRLSNATFEAYKRMSS